MKTDDFDLRYNDRVLAFHAWVNMDRDPNLMGREIQRVVKGPKLDAQACWIEGWADGAVHWSDMCREVGIKNDFMLKYDGSIFAFHIYVNTESDPYHIHKAILRIARGPRLDACVCWAEMFEGENGRKAWGEIQKMAVKIAADPNSKPYSLTENP